ncbi:MAG: hypothetical protein ACXWDL_04435 [Nocardioides sp.]
MADDTRWTRGRSDGWADVAIRSRSLLVAAAVLLAGVAAAEAWYLSSDSDPVPTDERPVVSGAVAHRSAVDRQHPAPRRSFPTASRTSTRSWRTRRPR